MRACFYGVSCQIWRTVNCLGSFKSKCTSESELWIGQWNMNIHFILKKGKCAHDRLHWRLRTEELMSLRLTRIPAHKDTGWSKRSCWASGIWKHKDAENVWVNLWHELWRGQMYNSALSLGQWSSKCSPKGKMPLHRKSCMEKMDHSIFRFNRKFWKILNNGNNKQIMFCQSISRWLSKCTQKK